MSTVPPKFISNDPIGKDQFESKSQDRVAESIKTQIQNSEFKLVGLDGEWGSGKSNVIQILRGQLEETHHFFIYDAWSHQEDLQRRSFLEELTDDLQKHHMVDQKEWKQKLEDLLAKKKRTEKKTIPRLSNAIVVTILVGVLVPLLKIVTDDLKELSLWAKLLIASAPILIAIGVWVIYNFRQKNKPRKWKLLELFYIYREKELTDVINETVSESEPSVREFRNWMHQVSQAIKKNENNPKNEVIIVFDNMDRLPKEKVKALWSSIHTFFSETSYEHVKVIVPFDRKHIAEAFSESKGAETDDDKAQHFINKTFKAIFTVSPTVLTDWKYFFRLKYTEAFGLAEMAEYSDIETLFDLYTDYITPRKIIAFINDLVSLKLIWKDDIDIQYIAVFALAKKEILQNPLQQILSRGFLSKAKTFFKNDDDLPNNIAALVYNVPLEKAKQVTIYRKIQLDIRDRNADSLLELSAHPDFMEMLLQVCSKEELMIADCAHCLDAFEQLNKAEKISKQMPAVWNIVTNKQMSIDDRECKFKEEVSILLDKMKRSPQLDRFINSVVKQFSIELPIKGEAYYEAMAGLDSFLKTKEIKKDGIFSFLALKELDPEEFLAFVAKAKDKYSDFAIETNKEKLDQLYRSNPLNETYIPSLQFIIDKYKMPSYLDLIENKVTSNNVDLNTITNTFYVYRTISENRPLSKKMDTQKIFDLIQAAPEKSPEYFELLAMRMALLPSWPNLGGVAATILTSSDQDVVDGIANYIEYYKNLGDLIIDCIGNSGELIKRIVKKIIQRPSDKSLVNTSQVMGSFEQICTTLEISSADLFSAMNIWRKTIPGDLTVNGFEDEIKKPSLVEEAFSYPENGFAIYLIRIAEMHCHSLHESQWETAFENSNSFSFTVLRILLEKGTLKTLPDNALTAYKNVLEKIADASTHNALSNKEQWQLLYNTADHTQLKIVARNIRDAFLNRGKFTTSKFPFYEQLLRENGTLEQKAEDVARIFLKPASEIPEYAEIIAINRNFYLPILEEAEKENLAADTTKNIWHLIQSGNATKEIMALGEEIDNRVHKEIEIKSAYYILPDSDKKIDVLSNVKNLVEKERKLHAKADACLPESEKENTNYRLKIDFEYKEGLYQRDLSMNEYLNMPY